METDGQVPPRKSPFLGIYMKCCRVYVRAYLNKSQTAFVAWCPRCAAQVRVPVSESGSSERFFEAS